MEGILEPQRLAMLASGGAIVVLAGLLVAVDFSKYVNRAFAALLACRGLAMLMPHLSTDPAWVGFALRAQPYLVLPAIPIALYFAARYPRPRGPLAFRGAGWLTLALALALDASYLANHDWYHTLAAGTAGTPAAQAGPGVSYVAFGALGALASATPAVLAGLGFLFVRDYTRAPAGTQRTTYFLVAAGFMLNGLYDGVRQVVGLGRLVAEPAGYPWMPWGWAAAVLPALSLVPALAGVLHLALQPASPHRRLERRLLALSAAAGLSGLAPLLLPPGSEFFAHPLVLVLLGIWRLSLAGFVGYALVRYSLFGIDLKVRSAIAWTWVAALFGATFFVVSETVSNLAAAHWGTLGGLGAAGLLALAARQLARAGRGVARFLVPGAAGPPVRDPHLIYRNQYLLLQEDGQVTAKERDSLEALRLSLGLTRREAQAIELRVPRVAQGQLDQSGGTDEGAARAAA